MNDAPHPDPTLAGAARFWEPRRILYNAILTAVAIFWIAISWPHFRPALTLSALAPMAVLALLANLCYCAAYFPDLHLQVLLSPASLRRFRWTLFIFGTLFAMLLESYWINDEIYPAVTQGPPQVFGGTDSMWTATFASNINFPAPLAVLGFLGAVIGLFLAIASALIFWFARKPKFARTAAIAIGTGAVVYLALLLGFSAGSRSVTLARGQEKYFCEIDCHLAYSIAEVQTQPDAASAHYVITLRTRFDESTTSPSRPKDATLTPSPREVRLLDSAGHAYTPTASAGTPLLTPLKPGDSYATQLEFTVSKDATGLRLLLNTTPAWPDHFVIGDENSLLHKKTYFAL
jgi:hypothetical protein